MVGGGAVVAAGGENQSSDEAPTILNSTLFDEIDVAKANAESGIAHLAILA